MANGSCALGWARHFVAAENGAQVDSFSTDVAGIYHAAGQMSYPSYRYIGYCIAIAIASTSRLTEQCVGRLRKK